MFTPETLPALPLSLVEAMAREEGWYASGEEPNRPQRNNNPLNLEYCVETIRAGATGGDPRFAVFKDAAVGFAAARAWLLKPAQFDPAGNLLHGYCNATLEQIISRFAPPTENETSSYLRNVCAWSELTPETVITEDIINAVRQ